MMKLLSPRHVLAMALAAIAAPCCAQTQPQFVSMPQYSVLITSGDRPGEPPQLTLRRDGETVFTMPIIAGLGSPSSEEKLSQTTYSLRKSADGTFELNATAKSSLWTRTCQVYGVDTRAAFDSMTPAQRG